jgi:hypothetical protein
MTATIDLDLEVRRFAQAVRLELSDLAPEEVDDLTEGLESDLTEHALDGDDFVLGDPSIYASELRGAAGLPPRGAAHVGVVATLTAGWRHVGAWLRGRVESSAAALALLRFVGSLRPLWWLARAWLGFTVLSAVIGRGGALSLYRGDLSLFDIVSFAVLLLISIQWGRGQWMPHPSFRVVRAVANIAAVLLIPVGLTILSSQLNANNYNNDAVSYQPGLAFNGEQISNVFAYDSDGNPISNVQLYDQDGNALSLLPGPGSSYFYTESGARLLPSDETAGESGWNVFPLDEVSESAINNHD